MPTYAPFFWLFNEMGVSTRRDWWGEDPFQSNFQLIPDMERQYLVFETGLMSVFEKGATLTKVPDNTPLEIPRFVLSSRNKRVLEVSLISALFKAQPDDLNSEEALRLFFEKAGQMFDFLKKMSFISFEGFRVSTLIQYPLVEQDSQVHDLLFDHFIKVTKPDELLDTQIKMTYKKDGAKISVAFEPYTKKSGTIDLKDPKLRVKIGSEYILRIPKETMLTVETGLSCRIIVNCDLNSSVGTEITDTIYSNIMMIAKDEISNIHNRIFQE